MWGMVDQVLSSGSNALVMIAVARIASQSEFGVVSVAMAVIVGVMSTMRGFVGTPISLQDTKESVRSEGQHAITLTGIVGCFLAIGILVAAFIVGKPELVLLALSCVVLLAQDCLRYVAIAQLRPKLACLSDGVWLAFSGVALIFTVVWGDSVSVGFVIAIWIVGGLVGLAILMDFIPITPRVSGLNQWIRVDSRGRLAHGTDFGVAAVSIILYTVVISSVMGSEAVAAIRGAGTIMGPLSVVYSALPLVLVPILIRSTQSMGRTFRQVGLLTILAASSAVLIGLLGSILPNSFGSQILGETWDDAADVVLIMGFEYAALAVNSVARSLLRAKKAHGELLRIRSVFTVGMLTSALTLSWFGSITLVAIGMATVTWASAVYSIYLVWKIESRTTNQYDSARGGAVDP